MKGIYLCAFRAFHAGREIVYQDLFEKRDVGGDALDIDVATYDYVIATPPCNWWSKANYRRNRSIYAMRTAHLLPCLLIKLSKSGKPFIVENVKNIDRMERMGVFELCEDLGIAYHVIGRHTYFSNVPWSPSIRWQPPKNIAHISRAQREGGKEVEEVIDDWIGQMEEIYEKQHP